MSFTSRAADGAIHHALSKYDQLFNCFGEFSHLGATIAPKKKELRDVRQNAISIVFTDQNLSTNSFSKQLKGAGFLAWLDPVRSVSIEASIEALKLMRLPGIIKHGVSIGSADPRLMLIHGGSQCHDNCSIVCPQVSHGLQTTLLLCLAVWFLQFVGSFISSDLDTLPVACCDKIFWDLEIRLRSPRSFKKPQKMIPKNVSIHQLFPQFEPHLLHPRLPTCFF